MRKIIILFVLLCALFSCFETENTADKEQAEQTETMMLEANRQIGMPNVINYQQKKLMKMIYELCDKEDLICYAYMFSDFQGKLIYIGKCIGFGIPFSAQFSNPEVLKRGDLGSYSGDIPMPQPEPNGLFMPTSSSATWLIMVDPETKELRPVYFEPVIVVSPFKLQ